MTGKRLEPQDVQVHMRISRTMEAGLKEEEARLGIPWTELARVAMGLGLDVMGVFDRGWEKKR